MKDKRKREKREVRRASGLLPHLLLFFERAHAGMFNLRHQLQDVMGFDGPFLTPGAVDLTISRLGCCDASHAERSWADCCASSLSQTMIVKRYSVERKM